MTYHNQRLKGHCLVATDQSMHHIQYLGVREPYHRERVVGFRCRRA